MKEFCTLETDQWVGFAKRRLSLHWLRGLGFVCIAVGAFDIGIFFWPLLGPAGRDFNEALITVLAGLGVLCGGLLMVYVDAFRQKQEIKRGTLKATGIFWNPTTNDTREGNFEFDIDSGTPIAFLRTGYRHRCNAIQHKSGDPWSSLVSKPTLRMRFTVANQLVEGEFASRVFNKRADLDTIIFTRGSIVRVKGLKANPCHLCRELGSQLKEHATNLIDVQLEVHWVRHLPNSSQSSNAGVIGAGLFGAVGGAVGAVIEEKKKERQRQEHADQQAAHDKEARELFHKLQEIASEFGWATRM